MDYLDTPQARFEERLRNLLKLLGFERIGGGLTDKIGNNQIDVYGKSEGKMVIIECTTQKKNLRSKLEEFKGKIPTIRRGIPELEHYRELNKKNKLAFIFASKYSDIRTYENLAKNDPQVFIFDSNKISYYEKIAKAIPIRAKYDFLTDIGFSIDNDQSIIVPAFKIQHENYQMYNFFISPDDLIKIAYVARRESLGTDYYQRMIEVGRLKKITEFLDKGGIFPNNIVVGINGSINFHKITQELNISQKMQMPKWVEIGLLELPKQYDGCWIIDGQHRLFSFTKKGMAQKLAVLAFDNLSLNKQTEFFVSINKNAKPINPNLLWDLEGDLRPTSEEGIISNIVKQLNNEPPFKGEISIPSVNKSKKCPISIQSFCNSVQRSHLARHEIKSGLGKLILKNPYFNNDHKVFIINLKNALSFYFECISNCVGTNKDHLKDFIIDNSGVNVFVELFKITLCRVQRKLNEKDIEKYALPIIAYLETKHVSEIKAYVRKSSTSSSGRREVLIEFLKLLVDVDSDIKQYIGEDQNLTAKLIDLESNLRRLVKIGLIKQKVEIKDIKRRFPHIIQDIESRLHREINSIEDVGDEFVLGHSKDIILDFWTTIFRSYFIKKQGIVECPDQFPTDEMFKATLAFAITYRNKLLHDKMGDYTKDDETNVEKFAVRISKILDYYLKQSSPSNS
ncbi:MAG: DGQHR domain-containing protein [Microgenomates group bacterium]